MYNRDSKWAFVLVSVVAATLSTSVIAGRTYHAYSANLHVHSNVSGMTRRHSISHSLDHTAARTPQATVKRQPPNDHTHGLEVIGLSDHDDAIDSRAGKDWDFLGWLSRETDKDQVRYATCLRGFEWSYSGVAFHSSTYDHANVFGSDTVCVADSTLPVSHALKSFYEWLRPLSKKQVIAQFNHIFMGTHFRDFASWDAELDRVFCLIELGGHDLTGYHSLSSCETYFNSALIKGWHVAPALGTDNFGPLDDSARDRCTKILAENRSVQTIISALQARRAYASEDRHMTLAFTCTTSGVSVEHEMGEEVTLSNNEAMAFNIKIPDPTDVPGNGSAGDRIAAVDLMTPTYDHMPKSVKHWEPSRQGFSETVTLSDADLQQYRKTARPTGGQWCFFVRARQADGDCAYSAPIWIDEIAAQIPGNSSVSNLTTSLVLDVSGSMSEPCPNFPGTKLDAAKEAVQRILRIVGNAAKAFSIGVAPFGIVSFTDNAQEVQAVTPDLDVVGNAIASMQPVAMTNLGDGVAKGFEQLGQQQGDRCIILLSDGLANVGLSRDVLMDSSAGDNPVKQAADQGIRIYTVGFGSQIDEELLKQIAQMTGGEYYYADDGYSLSRMYVRVCLSSRGDILMQQQGTIRQGQTQLLEKIKVEYARAGLSGVVTCLGSEVAPQLKDPSGKLVDASYPGATLIHGNPSCVFVKNPRAGEWEVSAVGLDCHGAEPFEAIVSAEKPKYSGGSGGGGASGKDDVLTALLFLGSTVVVLLLAVVVQRRRAVPITQAPLPHESTQWVIQATGPFGRRIWSYPGTDPITIGRAFSNAVVLDDPQVSSSHAILRPLRNGWLLVDVGSRNGTFVAGRRVGRLELSGGESIRLGDSHLTLRRIARTDR